MVVSETLYFAGVIVLSVLLAAAVGASYAYVDLSLIRAGASPSAIGVSAAMPALCWLLVTPLIPWILKRIDFKVFLQITLLIGALSIAAFPLSPDITIWAGLRFLFGGALGIAFRLIELWINAASPERKRAQNTGIYAGAFCCGAMIGANAIPIVGVEGWSPVILIMAFTLAGLFLASWAKPLPAPIVVASHGRWRLGRYIPLASLPILAAFLGGLFEAVSYTMLPVYTIHSGLSEDLSVQIISIYLLGVLLFPWPFGMLADRFGKIKIVLVCAAGSAIIPALLTIFLHNPVGVVIIVFLWGGFCGSIYSVSLALLPDYFQGQKLLSANVAFGSTYALGCLLGPLVHGLAMDWRDPEGLMISASAQFLLFILLSLALLNRSRAS